jgi:hypothetical protein
VCNIIKADDLYRKREKYQNRYPRQLLFGPVKTVKRRIM